MRSSKRKNTMKWMKIEDNLTPQLFDGEKILANTRISKELGKLYIQKIKDWYVRRFQEYKRIGLCDSFEISIYHQKIKLKYQAEGKLHGDINHSLRLELLVP